MPGNDLARQIKEHLTARQVVELYGFHPDRGGYIQCPFHAGDNHGSLKVYDGNKSGWHCFGCGAGGSAIDFVMRLFGLSFAQACLKLNCDFGLGLTGERPAWQRDPLCWKLAGEKHRKKKPLRRCIERKRQNTDSYGKLKNFFPRISSDTSILCMRRRPRNYQSLNGGWIRI